MRKYNIQNYIRYKKDVEQALEKVKKPENGEKKGAWTLVLEAFSEVCLRTT